jgi:MYXO-CTERM domain-containing protein
MKNFVRSGSVFLAFLCPALVAGSARATVVWTSTFESGDMSEWTSPAINVTKGTRKNVEFVGDEVYSGKLACKVTVHPDDLLPPYNQDRVDIGHVSTLSDEGKDSWLSGHYYMPANANVRNEFGWYESQVSYSNVMDAWVEPKAGGGTSISFGTGFLGATVLWTGDFSIGQWHQFAIHVHWSTNANLGSVDVWFDGVQVVTGKKAKTKADANRLFYQTGLHRTNPANFVDTIYFDDFNEADTQADAKIAAPNPNGGGAADGGAGAGGGAGADGGAGGAGSVGTAGAGGAGSSGTAGSGASGTAGTTGTAGSSASGTAGTGATGTAGASATGTAGATSTGTAGSSASGTAGTGATGTAGSHASKSGGCAVAGDTERGSLVIVALALLAAFVARRRRF